MEQLERQGASADQLVDELLPEELDWKRLVQSYPLAAVFAAAAGGFFIGRSRGRIILAALSGFAAETLTENVNAYLGKKVL